MERGTPFEALTMPEGGTVQGLDFVKLDKHDNMRLYFSPFPESLGGFQFAVFDFVLAEGDFVMWEGKTEYSCEMYGRAYFDGMRHAHTGKDGEGYTFWPDLEAYAKVFHALHELCVIYCPASDQAEDRKKESLAQLSEAGKAGSEAGANARDLCVALRKEGLTVEQICEELPKRLKGAIHGTEE
jgi:hypothetical protein